MIFDITRRLAIADPGARVQLLEGKAIILIDEIELHLHPLWQRQVLHGVFVKLANCNFL